MKQKIIIVDGYNVAHKTPSIEARMKVSLEDARIMLINHCVQWLSDRKDVSQFIVVFDGDSSVIGDRAQSRIGVRVIYTDTGETADARIIELADKNGKSSDCVIVSDDQEVARGARACGCSVMSVRDFIGTAVRKSSVRQAIVNSDLKAGLSPATAHSINESLKKEWGIQ
jgi:predicted RNA-binding protein with PIN domain